MCYSLLTKLFINIFFQREQIDKLDKEIQNGRKTQEAMIKQIQNYRDLVQTVSRRMKNEKEGKLKMQKEHQVKNFLAKEELAKYE